MDINKEIAEHTTQVEGNHNKIFAERERISENSYGSHELQCAWQVGKRLRPLLMQETYQAVRRRRLGILLESFMAADGDDPHVFSGAR